MNKQDTCNSMIAEMVDQYGIYTVLTSIRRVLVDHLNHHKNPNSSFHKIVSAITTTRF